MIAQVVHASRARAMEWAPWGGKDKSCQHADVYGVIPGSPHSFRTRDLNSPSILGSSNGRTFGSEPKDCTFESCPQNIMYENEQHLKAHYDSHPAYGTALTGEDVDRIVLGFNLSLGEKILDLGCGDGRFSQYLASKGKSVKAVDYSSVRINNGKRIYDLPEFVLSDIHTFLDTNTERFDTIIMLDVLEHLENPTEVINKCRQISSQVIASCPINMPYVAHLQVFTDITDFVYKLKPQIAGTYKHQAIGIWKCQHKYDRDGRITIHKTTAKGPSTTF